MGLVVLLGLPGVLLQAEPSHLKHVEKRLAGCNGMSLAGGAILG